MPRSYPPETRLQVIELARSGTRVGHLASTFGMSEATISVTSGPQGLTNDPTPTFSFSVAVPGAALQCGFDSALAPCGGQTGTAAPLADGAHSFDAAALARDGVSDGATRTFTVDTKPPETSVEKKPKKKLRMRKTVIEFIASEPGSTFSCTVDKKAAKACAEKLKLKRLKPGKHKVTISATDPAGNVESKPETVKFRVVKRR